VVADDLVKARLRQDRVGAVFETRRVPRQTGLLERTLHQNGQIGCG
jgi:hypothetical protein